MCKFSKRFVEGASALVLVGLMAGTAVAGGFAVREQSTSGLGAAFAGNAAGYDLSTIYWNPAGVAIAGQGLTTESHAALIIPDSEVTSTTPMLEDGANDIGKVALVPASYAAYRINDKWTIGYGFNAPFGLGSEADRKNWGGDFEFREAELTTYNFNPVVGYQVSPTLAVGLGLQVQYAKLRLDQATMPNGLSAKLKGDDWSYGFTAGLLWRPTEGTSIGIGYRSMVEVELEGGFTPPGGPTFPVNADLDQPEIATISLRQSINERTRFLATFEWTNWSRLGVVPINGTDAFGGLEIEANWDDGYFLSGGLEYDYSEKLTVRGGIAYEWSPVQDPEQRLTYVPDNDRVWLSVGATYKWSEATSIDLAYTHIFVEDGDIERPSGYTGEADSSVDIIGVSFKTKWGADGPFGLLSGLNN